MVGDRTRALDILFLQGRRANGHGMERMDPGMEWVEGEAAKVDLPPAAALLP